MLTSQSPPIFLKMLVTKEQIKKLFAKYLESDPQLLRAILKKLFSYKENIIVFSQLIFSHIVVTEIPDFHKEVYDFLLSETNEAFAAPRGHAKSSLSMIAIIWFIVNEYKKYIVYMSQSHSKTVQFIEPIRSEFKDNKILRFIYGDLTPKQSKDEDGRDREGCIDIGQTRLEAVSFEKNIRGFKYKNTRPDLIIGDDIEDDDRVINPDLRLKDENKLNSAVIPSLSVTGCFKMIGTILHQDSLLKKKILLYNGKIYKAVLDEEWTIFLFPSLYSKEKLLQIKTDIGSVSFEKEYLNNPIDTTVSLIKPNWITQSYREDISSEDLRDYKFSSKVLGVDFAFSDRITADKSAFTGVGKKDDFFYIIHNETKKGMSALEQLNYISTVLQPIHEFDKISLEENSIMSISKDLSSYNLPLKLFWTAGSDPATNQPHIEAKKDIEWQQKRHTVGKFQLINRMATLFENNKIIIPYKTETDKQKAHQLFSELTTFALNNGKLVEVGVHSDIGIALGYALETLNYYRRVVSIA